MTAASPNPHSQSHLPGSAPHPPSRPPRPARASGRGAPGRRARTGRVPPARRRREGAARSPNRCQEGLLSLFRPQAKGKSYSLGVSKALRLPVNTKMPVEALIPAPQSLGRRTSDLPGVLKVMLTPPLSWNDHQVSDPKRIPS